MEELETGQDAHICRVAYVAEDGWDEDDIGKSNPRGTWSPAEVFMPIAHHALAVSTMQAQAFDSGQFKGTFIRRTNCSISRMRDQTQQLLGWAGRFKLALIAEFPP